MTDKRIVIDPSMTVVDTNSCYLPLVILKKTGVWYTSQCGGHGCSHPEVEGFCIAVNQEIHCIDDCNGYCFRLGFGDNGKALQKELAHKIENGFRNGEKENYDFRGFKFDFDRIDELEEGWWPVLYRYSANYDRDTDTYTNELWYKAILIGFNCD